MQAHPSPLAAAASLSLGFRLQIISRALDEEVSALTGAEVIGLPLVLDLGLFFPGHQLHATHWIAFHADLPSTCFSSSTNQSRDGRPQQPLFRHAVDRPSF